MMSLEHHHHGERRDGTRLGTAFLLNLGFTVVEVIGGLWTNSVAILSDAVHDSGDCLSLGIAWYLQRLSKKGKTELFPFGYQRFSVLGALVTGLVLFAGLVFMLWRAVPRLFHPEAVHSSGMAALAIVGILANGLAAFVLRGGKSLNESIVSWHLIEDVLGWVAVLLGSLIMMFWNVPIIDPVLSILIALFILWNVSKNLKQVLLVFLQTAPKSFNLHSFEARIRSIPKVLNAHHTQSWSIDGEHHVLSTHIILAKDATQEDVVNAKSGVHGLLNEHHFQHVTIETEIEGEDCAAREAS